MTRFNFSFGVVTYPSDYMGQVTLTMIENLFKKERNLKYLICKSHGDEEIKHDHFHAFLWFHVRRCDFTNEKRWDIPLQKVVYSHCSHNEDGKENTVIGYSFDSVLLPAAVRVKELKVAHPNIRPKKYGKVIDMYKYVNDQAIDKVSNFDLTELLDDIGTKTDKQLQKDLIKLIKSNRDKTKEEALKLIDQNDELTYIYFKNSGNWEKMLDKYCSKKQLKPEPYWGKYYLPKKLYNYCIDLDKWVEHWMTNIDKPLKERQLHKRPKACLVFGKGDIGKTSLFMCFGDPAYLCNNWNRDHIDNKCPFVICDDYDNFKKKDFDGQLIVEDDRFWAIKGFIAGQDRVDCSDKFKNAKAIENGRPCIFISNYDYETRFKIESREYINSLGTIVVECKRSFKIQSKDWIEGHNDYVCFDTRNTWYYKNLVRKNNVNKLLNISDSLDNDLNKRKLEFEEYRSSKKANYYKFYYNNSLPF